MREYVARIERCEGMRRGYEARCEGSEGAQMWQVSSALKLLKEEHKYDKALEILDAHPHLQVLIKTCS